MWWPTAAGVVAFVVVLGASFASWRRRGAGGTGRAYMIGPFAIGGVWVLIGVWALVAGR